MHGYDLRDQGAALFGTGEADHVARVKSDYRQTLADMHYTYLEAWTKWCNARGELARNQAHGAPGNLLDLYGIADIPETETFGSTPFAIPGFRREPLDTDGRNQPNPSVTRFASSAAHVMGRKLASCETLTWLREHFRTSLSMAKPEIDQMFLAGINHIIYHGACYSPEDAAWPGWLFYASVEINPRDTMWRDLPELNRYIARCQSVLQSGQPDNDVLVYWPIYDNWHDPERLEQKFTVHAREWMGERAFAKTVRELTDLGVSFDYISDRQLDLCKNSGAEVSVPGGKYRAILVPPTAKMPATTLRRLVELARGGVKILFCGPVPNDVPGFGNLELRRSELLESAKEIQLPSTSRAGVRTAELGSGMVLAGDNLESLVSMAGIGRERFVADGVGFIRRRHEQGHTYFIAALGAKGLDGWVRLGVPCSSAVLLDAVTGNAGIAATRTSPFREAAGAPEVYLQLAPGQSIIVRTFESRKAEGPPWKYLASSGAGVELAGNWQVEFLDGQPTLPAPFKTEKLDSWTTLGDDAARTFAGTARYRIEFARPAGAAEAYLLDLGDVRESAHVRLNGKQVGAAWSLPFQVRLDELKDRGNLLEIDVTNLSANRLRDMDIRGVKWRIMKEINYVNIRYRPFDASQWPLAPSGLLGPVSLVPMRSLEPSERER
jgi:hypothetical protein